MNTELDYLKEQLLLKDEIITELRLKINDLEAFIEREVSEHEKY